MLYPLSYGGILDGLEGPFQQQPCLNRDSVLIEFLLLCKPFSNPRQWLPGSFLLTTGKPRFFDIRPVDMTTL